MTNARRLWAAILVVSIVAAGLFHNQILWAMGAMLVYSEAPEHADIVVTLAGDATGHRILEAAELVRQGYAPKVLVSGAGTTYGIPQSRLEIDLAVRHGYPPEYFIPMQHHSLSTRDEARDIAANLEGLGVHRFLLVTSLYHTARARRIMVRTVPRLTFRVVGSNYPHWNRGYWWKNREGQKIWLSEAAKTVADFFRI